MKTKARLAAAILTVLPIWAYATDYRVQMTDNDFVRRGESSSIKAEKHDFVPGDEINAFVTIKHFNGDDFPHRLEAKWYRCGKLVHSQIKNLENIDTHVWQRSHHAWFWIGAAAPLAGSGQVDIFADGEKVGEGTYQVRDQNRKAVDCPNTEPEAEQTAAPDAAAETTETAAETTTAAVTTAAVTTAAASVGTTQTLSSASAVSQFVGHRHIHILMGGTLFRFNGSRSDQMYRNGAQEIAWLAQSVRKEYERINGILVTGYADYLGSRSYNQSLSQARAETVKRLLIQNGIEASLIKTQGRGEDNPVKECPPSLYGEALRECLAPNRRVEIEVYGETQSDLQSDNTEAEAPEK